MAILLPLITLLFTLFSVKKFYGEKSILENIIISALLLSTFIVVSTEFLGLLGILTTTSISCTWLLFLLTLVFYTKTSSSSILDQLKALPNRFKNIFLSLSFSEKSILFILSILLSLILLQGIIYAPNNWDSMTYHLARVMQWIQNQSLENFSTHNTRQLYQPLFSEYSILHTLLLSQSDYFANNVQTFYFILSGLTVYGILKELSISRSIRFLALILCYTLPEGILESSSTQNDVVHTFFILATIYFCIKSIKNFTSSYVTLFGISVGLALLTKALAYLYIPFIGLIFTFFILKIYWKKEKFRLLYYSFLVLLPIVLINLGHSTRNYQFSHNILGTDPDHTKGIIFEKTSPKLILSTCLKNISCHSDEVFIGKTGDQVVQKLHNIIGMDLNEPGTNIFDSKFEATHFWKNHEDLQPNFLHFLLFSICIILSFVSYLSTRKIDFISSLFLLVIIFQFVFMSAYLCWEVWNTRIEIPIFFEAVIFICLQVAKIKSKILLYGVYFITGISIVYGFYLGLFNRSRPILHREGITAEIFVKSDRYQQYFANNPEIYPEYKELKQFIQHRKSNKIGFNGYIDAWEYPITVLNLYGSNVQLHSIIVKNITKKYENKKESFDYIVSTHNIGDTLHYHTKTYKLENPENKFIFRYVPM